MKLKDGFVLREVAGSCVVVPTGAELNLNGMITLNETAKTLWKALSEETDTAALTALLMSEYGIDEELAQKAVEGFVAKLREHGFINE